MKYLVGDEDKLMQLIRAVASFTQPRKLIPAKILRKTGAKRHRVVTKMVNKSLLCLIMSNDLGPFSKWPSKAEVDGLEKICTDSKYA